MIGLAVMRCMCVVYYVLVLVVFFFKQKTAYEMRISDWSSDVCSSDLWTARRSHQRYSAGPYCDADRPRGRERADITRPPPYSVSRTWRKIGRASCRERVCQYV